MDKCYIISVGGTGSRVIRAFNHLVASGVFYNTGEKFRIMHVDSDSGSAAPVKKLIDRYKGNEKQAKQYSTMAQCFNANSINQIEWTPLSSGMGTLSSIMKSEKNQEFTAGSVSEKIYKFLYTPKEQGEEECKKDPKTGLYGPLALTGGFYSHTSIGSYYMTKDIHAHDSNTNRSSFTDDAWKRLFNGIEEDNDKAIIICSMFGGTGASGVAPLARAIRECYPKLQIAGVFYEPYFTTGKDGASITGDIVNSNNFNVKSKIAIDYYNKQNFCKSVTAGDYPIFTQMYFLGEDDGKRANVSHIIEGNQPNPPSIIEMYGAIAILDFIKRNVVKDETGNIISEIMIGMREKNYKVGFDFADSRYEIASNLTDFLCFSIFYTKFLYHAIASSNKKLLANYKWLKTVYNIAPDNGLEFDMYALNTDLYEFCKDYIDWIKIAIIEGDQTNNWFGVNTPRLLDFEVLPGDVPLQKCRNMDELLPGFIVNEAYKNKKVIRRTSKISMEYIYTELSTHGGGGFVGIGGKSKKQYKDLIRDIISLIKEGELAT